MDLSEHYDEIARCNRCGFCQFACPVFRATKHEAGVARGRIALLRAFVEDRVDNPADLEEALHECLLCGACVTSCFTGIPATDLIVAARGEYLEQTGRGPLHRLLFNHLLPHPRRLRLAAKAAAFGKKTGASKVVKALGLLRFLGRDFPKAEAIVSHFPKQALREKIEPGPLAGEGDSLRVGYFVGCGTDIMCPDAGEALVHLLRGVAKSVSILDNCCCGLPPSTYGDLPAAQRLARKNLELLKSDEFDVIVTNCSSCAAFLKKYPELLGGGSGERQAAEQFSSRIQDAVQWLAAHAPRPSRGETVIATYHDPCHASRGQDLVAEPREVLRSLPGLEYRELPEADWCCGGAGSYALSHYERSLQVLDRKIDNVEKTGANLLVTSCPACIIHLSYGVRLRGLDVRVCHLSQVLAEAMADAAPDAQA